MPTRYSDVTAIAHDIEHFSSLKVAVIPFQGEETSARSAHPGARPAPDLGGPTASHLDPQAASCPGSPTTASPATRPSPASSAGSSIDTFIPPGHADAAEQYSQQIPVRVIAKILGVPRKTVPTPSPVGSATSSSSQTIPSAANVRSHRGSSAISSRRSSSRRESSRARICLSELLRTKVDGVQVEDS